MPISYSIVESNTPIFSGLIARVPRGNRVSLEEIARSMAERTGISRIIVQSVLEVKSLLSSIAAIILILV
ncbi:MAG: hypothetical protein BWK79_01795 [Beggiatoa sp. IS2]|nr:MAG: hypothetical protein BWK79_01795 [Beggiatoa sp. IS2]